jgi:hypothetical protein
MTRHIGISVPHRRVEDDDDIQEYKRPWVGLTDEDQFNLVHAMNENDWDAVQFLEAAEAKLKEKNT